MVHTVHNTRIRGYIVLYISIYSIYRGAAPCFMLMYYVLVNDIYEH